MKSSSCKPDLVSASTAAVFSHVITTLFPSHDLCHKYTCKFYILLGGLIAICHVSSHYYNFASLCI